MGTGDGAGAVKTAPQVERRAFLEAEWAGKRSRRPQEQAKPIMRRTSQAYDAGGAAGVRGKGGPVADAGKIEGFSAPDLYSCA